MSRLRSYQKPDLVEQRRPCRKSDTELLLTIRRCWYTRWYDQTSGFYIRMYSTACTRNAVPARAPKLANEMRPSARQIQWTDRAEPYRGDAAEELNSVCPFT